MRPQSLPKIFLMTRGTETSEMSATVGDVGADLVTTSAALQITASVMTMAQVAIWIALEKKA